MKVMLMNGLKYVGIGLAIIITGAIIFFYGLVLSQPVVVKKEKVVEVVEPTIYQCMVSSDSGQSGLIWYSKIPEEQLWVTYSKIIIKCNKQTKEMCIISSCKVVNELPDAATLDALKEEMQKREKEKSKIYT